MPIERDSSFTRAIDSAVLIRFSRVAIVFATLVGLPVAGYGLKRVINRADEIATVTDKTASRLDLLDQSVRLNFEQRRHDVERIEADLRDKESRLRVLEHAAADHYGPLRGRSPN